MSFRSLWSWCGSAWLSAQGACADTLLLDYGLTHWTYREPEIAVQHEGWLPTLAVQWRPAVSDDAPGRWRGAASLAGGTSEYIGSGRMSGQPVTAARVSLSYDMPVQDSGWTWGPLLAYDRLDNDARGATSTGARGYRRTNQRWSAGVQWWSAYDSDWQWQLGLSGLLRGWQTSALGDIGGGFSGLSPVVNLQRQGWGGLLGVCRRLEGIRWCAQWQSWIIQRSDALRVQSHSGNHTVYEPTNRTNLMSITLQHFFD